MVRYPDTARSSSHSSILPSPICPRAPDRRLSRRSRSLSRSRRCYPGSVGRYPGPRRPGTRSVAVPILSATTPVHAPPATPGARSVTIRSRRPLPIAIVSTCDREEHPNSRIPGRCYSLMLLLSPVVFVDWETFSATVSDPVMLLLLLSQRGSSSRGDCLFSCPIYEA